MSLNKNQLLILSRINGSKQITFMLSSLSKELNILLSTLKLNAKVLKELDLISFFKGMPLKSHQLASSYLKL